MRQKGIGYLLFLMFFSGCLEATVYEDGKSAGRHWHIYDTTPMGATISSYMDADKGEVVYLHGAEKENGYALGAIKGQSNAWNNRDEKVLQWTMKYDESFLIFVSLETKKGHRYLIYAPVGYSTGALHGLGIFNIYGEWKTFSRDLKKDFKKSYPDNEIISVNGFFMRGSGFISKVELLNSKYEKGVSLGSCDARNPEVQFIHTNEDWGHINDANKTIFCLDPKDYSDAGDSDRKQILITQSGTALKPRKILLYNTNNRHPAQLRRAELAKYLLKFYHADYWIVDRQAFWETTNPFQRNELIASSHNIFSRGYFMDTANNFSIRTGSVGNTIQHTHMEKSQWSVDEHNFYDTAAINLVAQNDGESVNDTIIVNNEIINYVDGIQTVRIYGSSQVGAEIDFSGTVIDHNLIYVTNIMYSDGSGNSDINGSRSFTENAIDLKAGSSYSEKPLLITNNMMWGYKAVDNTYSGLADAGAVIGCHYDVRNVIFKNNTVFKSDYGLIGGSPLGSRYPLENSFLDNNLFSQIHYHSIFLFGHENQLDGGNNVKISNNFFTQSPTAYAFRLTNTNNFTIENNLFSYVVNPRGAMWFGAVPVLGDRFKSENLTIQNNTFYSNVNMGIPPYAVASNNVAKEEASPFLEYQREYITRKFTSTPIHHTLF